MGLRFRKGIRILPGLRLNITKSGISSLSVGGKGISYNIGRKGTRTTGGIPGTGLSYSHYDKNDAPERIDPETGEITPARQGPPWLLILLIGGIVLALYIFRTQG